MTNKQQQQIPIRRPPGPRPVLLGDPPGLPTVSMAQTQLNLPNPVRAPGAGIYSFAPPPHPQAACTTSYQVQTQLPPPSYTQPSLSSVYTTMSSTPPQMMAAALFPSDQQFTMANSYFQAAAAQQQQQQQQLMAANPFLLAGYANLAAAPLMATPPPTAAQQFLYNAAAYQQQQQQQQQQTNTLGYGPNPAFLAGLNSYGLASPFAGQMMPPPVSSTLLGVMTTPPNLKRKLPIPPSPEASPEGPYIGQHSQGIGGHYADSYWRHKRAKN